jgi:hypothetical protein
MNINIPFELGETVYVADRVAHYRKETTYSCDHLGPMEHTERVLDYYSWDVVEMNFSFRLLDCYPMEQIFKTRSHAYAYCQHRTNV